MRRRIGRTAALLVLAASVVAGTGAGLVGDALTSPGPGPIGRGSGPTTGTDTPSPDGLLGADDLLTTSDFETIGWPALRVDSLASGEPQFAYACQRTSLAEAAGPTATVSVEWTADAGFTAAETVAELDAPPQARQLFRRVSGWYRDCTAGTGSRTPSTLAISVEGADGAAEVWRLGPAPAEHAAYGVLARAGERVALVDVYGDTTPVDPAGLRDLAQHAVDRLS
ncbi:hypothetical protein [Nocardioides sp.]|uniref:hypothetical protein n=1 Tax=Nocardioides sp. TaxID=35761 RepID=UPI0025F22DC0|nr:hypothetical protein [Nocardioides sp.]